MSEINYQDFFKKFGILTGIIFIVVIILVYTTVISRKSWNTNLKNSITTVLNNYEADTWQLHELYPLDNPITSNSICYYAKNLKENKDYKVMMIRIVTFYGPMPIVYTIDDECNVEFIGVSSLKCRVNNLLLSKKYNKNIDYWKTVIEDIFEKEGIKNEE